MVPRTAMPALAPLLLAALLLAGMTGGAAGYDWQWRPARATTFGENQQQTSYCRPEDHGVCLRSTPAGSRTAAARRPTQL